MVDGEGKAGNFRVFPSIEGQRTWKIRIYPFSRGNRKVYTGEGGWE